jgi:hypothetical protein
MVKSSVASFFSTYLLTTHKQVGSKNSTYLVITYFLTYIWDLFPTELVNQGETKYYLSWDSFIHNQVIASIQLH